MADDKKVEESSKRISIRDAEELIHKKLYSKNKRPKTSEIEKHKTPSKHISIRQAEDLIHKELYSRNIRPPPPQSTHHKKVKIPATLDLGKSTSNIKIPSEEKLYLSDKKREELYKEILLYLIELRNNRIDLENFLDSILKNADTRKSLVSELLEQIDVEQNQYNKLQLNVTLYTLIYATLYYPDFSKLSDALTTRFKTHVSMVRKNNRRGG